MEDNAIISKLDVIKRSSSSRNENSLKKFGLETNMEDSAIISILEGLKTSSSNRIANNLIKIRQQVIVTDNGIKKFKANGGISLMISLLHKPNEKISDLVLSILGNCCMKQEVVLEVEKLNGLRYVIHIIKNIAKDSILCRACRVVGNVAQFENTVDNVHEYGAVAAICGILNSTDKNTNLTPSTKLMAVRALRLLWTNKRRQHEMLTQNVPKTIVMILIEHKSKWSTSPQDKDLLLGILRCLLHFTESPSPELVLQMFADGNGFQSIVSLIPLNPYFTMKCITNLSTVATTRSVLETNEAARILIERLTAFKDQDPCLTWPIEDLNALCLLCRHAATREEVRSRNGLPLLLSVVKNSSNKKQQGQVLHALLHFIYDEVSLKILISDGLVKTLLTCLAQFLDLMKCQHNVITEKKHQSTCTINQQIQNDEHRSYVCRKLLKFKNGSFASNNLKRAFEHCDDTDDVMEFQSNKRARSTTFDDQNSDKSNVEDEEEKSKVKLKTKLSIDCGNSSQILEKPSGSQSGGNLDDSLEETNRLNLKNKQLQRYEDTLSPIPFDTRLSPQPSTSYSPSCTPPRSIITDLDEEDSNSDDSIRYSPVCSDSESDDDDADDKANWDHNFVNFENEDFVHYEMGDNELENALEEEMEPKTGETRTITWLLVLLSRVSYMDDLDPTFGNIDTVQVLLRYMELSKQPITRAASILLRIASQGDFLINLLNNKLILRLHNLLRNPLHGINCKQCMEIKNFINYNVMEKLTRTIESGYVKGQIAHQLLKGELDKQQKLIISIPYLVQSKSLIRSLFDHCRGLQILLLAVSNIKIDDWWDYAVNALGFLAIALNIKDPKKTDDLILSINDIDCTTATEQTVSSNDNTAVITFELDDESQVHANRNLLIEQSDFFKVLLTGAFMESNQSVIRLSNVTANGFRYLLTLLKHYQDNKEADNDSFPLCVNSSVAFEVLILADRFLIDDLTDTLSRAILKYRMCSCNVAQLYKYSLESHTNYLRVECIAYGLVGLTEKSRVNVFKDIINDGYGESLIEDFCDFSKNPDNVAIVKVDSDEMLSAKISS
ncbi:uncharacterized protein LOC123297650 [Chrysoperla carnea]|uniref:uncharacterized protein LOC123297650 n=1 Tax=Chrysoperla carnea TaxID=189513 RepID=UPI001D090ED3|nr:uncharacterized protein LOC123297650 [Chrysoperla carnea]